MKFNPSFTSGRLHPPFTIAEVVESDVESSERDGQLESLQSQLRALTRIVGQMSEFLPAEHKIALAEKLCYEPANGSRA